MRPDELGHRKLASFSRPCRSFYRACWGIRDALNMSVDLRTFGISLEGRSLLQALGQFRDKFCAHARMCANSALGKEKADPEGHSAPMRRHARITLKHAKLHHLYIALALFDIAVIGTAVYLNQRLSAALAHAA